MEICLKDYAKINFIVLKFGKQNKDSEYFLAGSDRWDHGGPFISGARFFSKAINQYCLFLQIKTLPNFLKKITKLHGICFWRSITSPKFHKLCI